MTITHAVFGPHYVPSMHRDCPAPYLQLPVKTSPLQYLHLVATVICTVQVGGMHPIGMLSDW